MSRSKLEFSPQALNEQLRELPAARRYLVGYSGGADSSALLLALHRLAPQLECTVEAVHFNHGLQSDSDNWQRHCEALCKALNIHLHVRLLELDVKAGSSPELAARRARYASIETMLTEGDVYLTAHQADDQAETLFLNLMRGSGVDGLAAIPHKRRLASGWLARPLLSFRKQELELFLRREKCSWLEDPSNQNEAMDRNFVRASVFPLLAQRWPAMIDRLNQTACHLADQAAALREVLSLCGDLVSVDEVTLPLGRFKEISSRLQAEVIRNWARLRGALPPPAARLYEFLRQLQNVRSDSHTELCWGGWRIKHHANRLWLQQMPDVLPCPLARWPTGTELELGNVFGSLGLIGEKVDQIDIRDLGEAWICSRSTLEKVQTSDSPLNKKIKEIMRLAGIPPWLRSSVPMLVLDGRLAAIGDWWLSPVFKEKTEMLQVRFHWQPGDKVLCAIQTQCHHAMVDRGTRLV